MTEPSAQAYCRGEGGLPANALIQVDCYMCKYVASPGAGEEIITQLSALDSFMNRLKNKSHRSMGQGQLWPRIPRSFVAAGEGTRGTVNQLDQNVEASLLKLLWSPGEVLMPSLLKLLCRRRR